MELVTRFLESMAGSSPHTLSAYRTDLTIFSKWYIESYGEPPSPDAVADEIVPRTYKAYLVQVRKYAPATVNRRLTALRMFGEWLRRNKYVAVNSVADIEGVREPYREIAPRSLSRVEINRLLRAATQTSHRFARQRDPALLQTMIHTGIRIGEAASLTVGDVKLNERSGMLHVHITKGLQPREIPLNASARRALQAWLDFHKPESRTDALFPATGKREFTTTDTLRAVIERAARRANVEDCTPHTLRHTFARLYLEDNPGDIPGLQLLLGHDDPRTTMVYLRPSMDELAARLEASSINIYG